MECEIFYLFIYFNLKLIVFSKEESGNHQWLKLNQTLWRCNLVFGLGLIHQSSPLSVLSDTGAIEEMATRDSELCPAPVAKNPSDNPILNDQTLV